MSPSIVTCICPTTADRRSWLPKAIACFQAQTFNHDSLRMLIVADFPGDTEGLIPADDPRISVIVVGRKLTVGEKRNIGCAEASDAEIICHFDSDDVSAPGRVDDQVKRLNDTGKSVTGYHSLVFTDGKQYWEYTNHPTAWASDTSLCYKRDFWVLHNFDELNDGLEANFRLQARKENQFVTADGRTMIQCWIHGGNTSIRREHINTDPNSNWKNIKAPVAV